MTSGQSSDISKGLRDKYAIFGAGEAPCSRKSGRTTRHMGVEAVRNAMADCEIRAEALDRMMSYQIVDSTPSRDRAARTRRYPGSQGPSRG